MKPIATMKTCFALFLLCVAGVTALPAQTFTSLLSFNSTDGRSPYETALVQGLDGNLYGTTRYGGTSNSNEGTVFKITPTGTVTTLWNFCQVSGCPDGAQPLSGLVLVTGGNLYGTTASGGVHGYGSVFKITPTGTLTTVYSFCALSGCADGINPNGLIQGADGNFYGTTYLGGTGGCGGCHGGGTFFKLTTSGTLTTLHSFCTGTCGDGSNPAAPIQATDGNFYGTAVNGGSKSAGTVWKLTSLGTVTVLYTFCSVASCTDGIGPFVGLVQASDGNFYGTTDGGDSNEGTVFKVTPTGTFTSLYSFGTVSTDGGSPLAPLIQATDGNLYGTAYAAHRGLNCCGTIYQITTSGALTTQFTLNGTDGNGPWSLMQDTDGVFYGLTYNGGVSNYGTAFDFATGLGPFVRLVTNSGKVGKTIDVIGQGFSGATAVSFGGVAATFKNVADTYLTATVPAGALTGSVKVTTFTSTLNSNQIFRVTPQLLSFNPASGKVGTAITLTGVSLTQTTKVTIGGRSATFTVNSDTQVTATIPVGAKTGQKISIITSGGTANSTTALTIMPSIKNFTPTSGPVGTAVTITGNTFTGATGVSFGSVAATSFQVISDTQLDALVPTGAVTGAISVITPGGTGTSTGSFTVTP